MSSRRNFIAIAGAGSLGAVYAARLAKDTLDKPLAPGCSNDTSKPTGCKDYCGQIDRIYLAKKPKDFSGCWAKVKKPKKQKPKRIKIKGQQYARPFYIYEP